MQTLASTNDIDLFNRIAVGDEIAYREIYDRHWGKVYALALAYLKQKTVAEDLVQEIFVKLWTKRKSLVSIEKPDSYIYIMSRNLVINAFHRRMELGELNEDRMQIPDDYMLPDQTIDLKELQTTINKEIAKLPTQQQTVYRLSREEGLSHAQIAERLGIERTTVKNHMVRALNHLRSILDEHQYLVLLFLLVERFTNN